MKSFNRGFFVLVLLIYSVTTAYAGKYLYKDQVFNKPKFTRYVNKLGLELYNKTGISLRLVILKTLENNQTIHQYESNLIETFKHPTILLTFSALNKKVDIIARPKSLYKYFNKQQVLSPASSFLNSLYIAIVYSKNLKQFKATALNDGGTIIPLLAQKTKGKEETNNKYSAALFNGYADIASQIAKAKHITLKANVGNSTHDMMDLLRIIFYGVLLYAGFRYLKIRSNQKKRKK